MSPGSVTELLHFFIAEYLILSAVDGHPCFIAFIVPEMFLKIAHMNNCFIEEIKNYKTTSNQLKTHSKR